MNFFLFLLQYPKRTTLKAHAGITKNMYIIIVIEYVIETI